MRKPKIYSSPSERLGFRLWILLYPHPKQSWWFRGEAQSFDEAIGICKALRRMYGW